MVEGKNKRISRKKRSRIRVGVQIFFFLLIALIAVNHTLSESGNDIPILSDASLHAVCPFGGVVSIYQFAAVGDFVKKTHESSFILMIIVFALTLLAGPVFCGWVCPFGSFQEWLAKRGGCHDSLHSPWAGAAPLPPHRAPLL